MKYSEKYTITSFDVDINNNIRPTSLINYLQETANHQMRDRKPSYYDFFREGKSFVVTRMSIEVMEQIGQYEEVEVRTWACPAGGATFPRSYDIVRDGRVIVKAYSEWAVPNRNTGKLCRHDEIDISNYENEKAVELSIPKKYRFPGNLEFERKGEHVVSYSDCDMNLHVNNANYSNMLWDYIPGIEEKEITSINVRFNHEAQLGSTIDIYMRAFDNEFSKDPRASETFAFKTFVKGKKNVEFLIGVKEAGHRT